MTGALPEGPPGAASLPDMQYGRVSKSPCFQESVTLLLVPAKGPRSIKSLGFWGDCPDVVRSLNTFGSKSFTVVWCWDHSEVKDQGGQDSGKTRARAGGDIVFC